MLRGAWLPGCLALVSLLGTVHGQESKPTLTPAQQAKLPEWRKLAQAAFQAAKLGPPRQAILAWEKLLVFEKEMYGPVHKEVADTLAALARLHVDNGDFAAARRLRQEQVAVLGKLLGAEDWRVSNARFALADLARLEKQTPREREQVAAAARLHDAGWQAHTKGQSKEAAQLCAQALAQRQQLLGAKHLDTLHSQYNLAQVLHDQGQLAEARSQHTQALQGFEEVLGVDHPATAQSGFHLGSVLCDLHQLAEARERYTRSLASYRRTLGPRSRGAANVLNNLGIVLSKQGEHASARQHLEQALQLRKELLGAQHHAVAITCGNLGIALQDLGDFQAAKERYDEGLAIYRQLQLHQHIDMANLLTNLASLTFLQGDLTRAKQTFEQALAIYKQQLGEQHPRTLRALHGLGIVLASQGDLAEARQCFEQVLTGSKQLLEAEQLEAARTHSCLGVVLMKQGELALARDQFERALASQRRILGEKHAATIDSLSWLGAVLRLRGDLVTAQQHCEQALALGSAVLDKESGAIGHLHNRLGVVLLDRGDPEGARRHCEQAVANLQQAYGDKHAETANALNNLGVVLREQRDLTGARRAFEQALASTRHDLERTALGQAERLQLVLAESRRYRLDNLLSLGVQDPTLGSVGYAEVLAWKGATFARQRRLRALRALPELAPLASKLASTATSLANLSSAPPELAQRATWRRVLERLTRLQERLETELAQASPAYRQQLEQERLTPAQLLQCLPPDVVLVDFLVFNYSPPRPRGAARPPSETRLLAFVLRRGQEISRLDLGPVSRVAELIRRWRRSVTSQAQAEETGRTLRKHLWEPLLPYVQGSALVLLAPDEVLGQLPFAALPGSKPGTYLLEEVKLATIVVPQLLPELLAHPAARREPSLLLVGDVDFDADPGAAAAGTTAAMPRSAVGARWAGLPGTTAEIAALSRLYRQHHGATAPVTVLQKQEASESAFRRQVSGRTVVHLATHGYFADARVGGKETDDLPRPHPGLLTGLVLAGANRQPEPTRDDGLLTALEVAELDLRNVDLVVLSACETGLGKSAGGEGVLGLQRAFQVAGARSTVTTLWSIPDEATRVLMERFYDNCWQKKLPKLTALREAQLWMLREGRAHAGVVRGIERLKPQERPDPNAPLPPYFWAAFVLSGDWR